MQGREVIRTMTTVVAATAFAAIAACASTQQYDTGSAAGTISLLDAPPATLNADELNMLHRMTDANILGHVAMGDSIEVVMAQFAERRTKTDDVLQFARRMD